MRKLTPILALAALLVVGCSSTLRSDNLMERTMRRIGAPEAIETGLVLAGPQDFGTFEKQVLIWSELYDAPRLVRFPAAQAGADRVERGATLRVMEGVPFTEDTAPGLLATAWRVPNLDAERSSFYAEQACGLLFLVHAAEPALVERFAGGVPKCFSELVPQVSPEIVEVETTRFLPLAGERSMVDVVHDPECRDTLWDMRVRVATMLDQLTRAGVPATMLDPLTEVDAMLDNTLKGDAP